MKRVLAILGLIGLMLQDPAGAGGQTIASSGASQSSQSDPFPDPTPEEMENLGALYIIHYGVPHPELVPGEIYLPPLNQSGGIEVPAIGDTGWKRATLAEGSLPSIGDIIGIHTDLTGTTFVLLLPIEFEPQPRQVPLAYGECDSQNFVDGSLWERNQHGWKFRAGSTPTEDGFSVDEARAALRRAFDNITHVDNNCDLPDLVSASHSYDGDTTQSVNINSQGDCQTQDGQSVVGFGYLGVFTVGLTCDWHLHGGLHTVDFRLNKEYFEWFAPNIPADCDIDTPFYGVENVGTHEAGHVFALIDATNSLYANQAMWHAGYACDVRANTLGEGDIRALELKY